MDSLKTPPAKPLTITIVGAGQRGTGYASYALLFPEWLQVVAVAEIEKSKRESFAKNYNLSPENVFEDWKDMVKKPRLSNAVAICTPDKLHAEPAVCFADLKYDILLEKPMAVSLDECLRITLAMKRNNVIFTVGHVLRYTRHMAIVMQVIKSGILGDILNIQHLEPVGYWHFAHSFVRGNWNREETSTFSLMSKCCHDLDLINYMMASKCVKVSSFGHLSHFRKENKPKEAADAISCFQCNYESSCPYSAQKIYIQSFQRGNRNWPVSVVVYPKEVIDIESLTAALKTGNYGKCVYESGNDVCDHQVVNFQFQNGATASFTMVAFTESICERKIRIYGSRGELNCDFSLPEVTVYDFATKSMEKLHISNVVNELFEGLPTSGHGGGDFGLMRSFVYSCITRDPSFIQTGPSETFDSHLLVFAAEHSRRSEQVVLVDSYKSANGIDC